MTNLTVMIQSPSRRLLSGNESRKDSREGREDSRGRKLEAMGRLLVVSIPLTVKGLTISADKKVIYITTNA